MSVAAVHREPLSGGAVLYERTADGVVVLTLNEPKNMNAWSNPIANGLFDGYDKAVADPGCKVIVLTGSGKAFCAGADMKGKEPLQSLSRGRSAAQDAELDRGICHDPQGRSFTHASRVAQPIICAINGACAGFGFTQALHCDIRFAAEGARFSSAFARRGLIAEAGISWTLPRTIGVGGAMDVLLSGRTFDAQEALGLGIVQRVFPKESLLEETLKYATDIAVNCPVSATAVIKQQVLGHLTMASEDALRESNLLMLAASSPGTDAREGIKSFVEKRKPNFKPYDPDTPLQKLKAELIRERAENQRLRSALAAEGASQSKL